MLGHDGKGKSLELRWPYQSAQYPGFFLPDEDAFLIVLTSFLDSKPWHSGKRERFGPARRSRGRFYPQSKIRGRE